MKKILLACLATLALLLSGTGYANSSGQPAAPQDTSSALQIPFLQHSDNISLYSMNLPPSQLIKNSPDAAYVAEMTPIDHLAIWDITQKMPKVNMEPFLAVNTDVAYDHGCVRPNCCKECADCQSHGHLCKSCQTNGNPCTNCQPYVDTANACIAKPVANGCCPEECCCCCEGAYYGPSAAGGGGGGGGGSFYEPFLGGGGGGGFGAIASTQQVPPTPPTPPPPPPVTVPEPSTWLLMGSLAVVSGALKFYQSRVRK